MYCSNCGKKNDERSKFCEACGRPLTEHSEPVVTPTKSSQVSPAKPAVSNRTRNMVMALVALIVLVASGGFLYLRSQSSPGQSATSHTNKSADQATGAGKEQQPLNMHISQIDNASFPEMTIYAKIDGQEEAINLESEKESFSIKELGVDGKAYDTAIIDLVPVETSNEMNINLVLDQSGSMTEENKIDNAKQAATKFLTEILKSDKNSIEVTSFDDYVYNLQPFTSNVQDLKQAINSIEPDGQTALYDAIYDALIQTNQKSGSRFVMAFTDGAENASLHSESEVVELSRLTGIPVYIIGIGSSTDYSQIDVFAERCNGEYFNVDVNNLSEMLLQIYDDIYQTQRDLYKITYKSNLNDQLTDYRTVVLTTSESGAFSGEAELDYMPKDSIASIDNAKLLAIISKRTSVENVAVAIVDLETDLEYRVGNARKDYVASGFYAPVYIVANGENQTKADEMMSKMDNEAGNVLINSFGGLSDINTALAQKGYTQTIFNRKFGDVAASKDGHENYTSAVDSAKILRDIYQNDGYQKMQWDLTKDGISLPQDATYYAHRGQGIGAAYNVFAIVDADKATYGIAIMTAQIGSSDEEAKRIAVPMMSEILAEVNKEMVGN